MDTGDTGKQLRGASMRAVVSAFGMGAFLMSAPALASDDAAVLAANDGFYAALNTLFTGDAGPMLAVWSHADDTTYMGPTGQYDRGWDAIHANSASSPERPSPSSANMKRARTPMRMARLRR